MKIEKSNEVDMKSIIKEFTKPVFSSEDDDGYTNAGLEDDTGGDNDVVYDVKDYTQLNKIKGGGVWISR